MEVFIPVVFLNVCAICIKSKWNTDSAESYLIALMGISAVLYLGGILNLLLPVTAGVFLCILIALLLTAKKGRSKGLSFAAALKLKEYFNPFVLLNNLSCLVFCRYILHKQPVVLLLG